MTRRAVKSDRPASALIVGALLVGLLACAGEAERDTVPIRGGPGGDGSLPDGALDLGPPAPDAAPTDRGPPPARTVWLVTRDETYADGVRARLQPPHAPSGVDPRDRLPEAALLVAWAGPGDDDALRAAWADGRAAGVLYDLGARIAAYVDPAEQRAVAVADVARLAATLSTARTPLRWGDAPLVVVDGPWDAAMGAAFAAGRARAEAVGVTLAWGAMIDPSAPWIGDAAVEGGPPPVDLLLPRCAVADPAARSRARQWSIGHGSPWLPCVSPPSNPRLDRPRAPAEAPRIEALERRLILARRVGAPVVIVDGAGGWRDDRQLDPVSGPATGAPVALTTAQVYRAYGDERLAATRRLLLARAGPPPARLGDPPALLDLVRSAGIIVERLEQTADGLALHLQDATGRGRYEVLLDDRPFIVRPDLVLRYARTDAAVAVDLVFEDGDRLLDLLPDDGDLDVRRSLDPFVGRRVEEATLVYRGGRDRLDVRVTGARVEVPP